MNLIHRYIQQNKLVTLVNVSGCAIIINGVEIPNGDSFKESPGIANTLEGMLQNGYIRKI